MKGPWKDKQSFDDNMNQMEGKYVLWFLKIRSNAFLHNTHIMSEDI